MRALSIHAGYRCRSSGVCCTSGWGIEVRPAEEALIRAGLGSGRLRPPTPQGPASSSLLVEADGLPEGASCHVGLDARGHCLFFDAQGGRRCSIHRDLGPQALPPACRHFPRVSLIAPHDVSVSLSHYCPTAARLLFDEATPLAIVAEPAAFPAAAEYEGLDARGHAPPLLRPGVLLGWDALERWEAHLVTLFARPETAPEAAVARLERLARTAASWSLRDGPFDAFFSSLLERDSALQHANDVASPGTTSPTRGLWETVVAAAAPGLPMPGFPEAFDELWAQRVAPHWRRHRGAVNRYLAARGFASWYSLLTSGLEAATLTLHAALSVLRVECVRRAESCDAPLGAEGLLEAIRASDLRLIHHARPEVLARLLDVPRATGPARA